jgi:hypothetical protein
MNRSDLIALSVPVGAIEIAARLNVESRTVCTWTRRNLMPGPDFPSVNGHRAWRWDTVLRWAGETGRLRNTVLREQFRRSYGCEPAKVRNGGRLCPSN